MGGTEYEDSNADFAHRIIKSEIELTSALFTKCVERPSVWLAVAVGTALGNSIVEVHSNEIGHVDKGRVPSTALDTTVHPINGSVRASSFSNLR